MFWSVGADGETASSPREVLAKELSGWDIDEKNSVTAEGVWARVNPKNPRQMVPCSRARKSVASCSRRCGATARGRPHPKVLDAAAIAGELKAWVAADPGDRADWDRLTKKERQSIAKDAQKLFTGEVDRARVSLAIEPLYRKRLDGDLEAKPVDLESRVRLRIYLRLFQLVFGSNSGRARPTQ